MTLAHYQWPSLIKDKQITTGQPHPIHTQIVILPSQYFLTTLFRVALSSIILSEKMGNL